MRQQRASKARLPARVQGRAREQSSSPGPLVLYCMMYSNINRRESIHTLFPDPFSPQSGTKEAHTVNMYLRIVSFN